MRQPYVIGEQGDDAVDVVRLEGGGEPPDELALGR